MSAQASDLKTNHVALQPASYFAKLYSDKQLTGGHVIMLGAGNEIAAEEALTAWPGSLQVGGGIDESNALSWIKKGAEKVAATCLSN